MSCAIIILCVASQCMFTATYVTYVKYDFIMADLVEKCITVKFCFKLKNKALETHQMFNFW